MPNQAGKSVDNTDNTSSLPGVGDQSWFFDIDPGSGDRRQKHEDNVKLTKSQWRDDDRQYMSKLVEIERMKKNGIDTEDMLADANNELFKGRAS